MSLNDRKIEIPLSWVLDEMSKELLRLDFSGNRLNAYMGAIAAQGGLSDAEIEDYAIGLNNEVSGVGAPVKEVLTKLRNDCKEG